MNKPILWMSIFALGVCLLMPKDSLAAEPPGQAYLSAEELLDLYESMYSRIHNLHVSYTNILEETKGDSPKLQSYTKFDNTETIEEGGKYYTRWTSEPKGLAETNSVPEMAFNGSATSRYYPESKAGSISSESDLVGTMLWDYMLLFKLLPYREPDKPFIRFHVSDKGSVRKQLEYVSGEWCHVVDTFSRDKSQLYTTAWFAVDKGGLPIKFERNRQGKCVLRYVTTKIGSAETDTGNIWFPEQASKEVDNIEGYSLYRFKVQSLRVNIETTPDMFKVSFPDGTTVVDTVVGVYYTTGTGAFEEKKRLGVYNGNAKEIKTQSSPEKNKIKPVPQIPLSETAKSNPTDNIEIGQDPNSVPKPTLGQLEVNRSPAKVLFAVLGLFTVCILTFLAYRRMVTK